MNVKLILTAAAVALIGFNAVAADKKAAGKKDGEGVVAAFDEAKFEVMDPKNPYSPEWQQLKGNAWTGPSVFYMKLKKGQAGNHTHKAAYHAVLVKGTAKHWVKDEDPAKAKNLTVGSYWFQPGGQVHNDECTDEGGCVIVLNLAGKFDFTPEAPAKK